MNPPTKTAILQEIAGIEAMELGKLSAYAFNIGETVKITPAMFRRRNSQRWRLPWRATPDTGN
jgi:hypothetical protein